MKKECESNARVVSLHAKRFGAGQWSFLGPGSEKWYSISDGSAKGEWDNMAEKMMLEFGESGRPVFRATFPLSRGQLRSKSHGKLSVHFCADLETIKTVFRTIISVNQLSLNGAVAEMCEEYETFHDRTGQPVVGEKSSSSFVLSVIKTEVPLDCDDPASELSVDEHAEFLAKAARVETCGSSSASCATGGLDGRGGLAGGPRSCCGMESTPKGQPVSLPNMAQDFVRSGGQR